MVRITCIFKHRQKIAYQDEKQQEMCIKVKRSVTWRNETHICGLFIVIYIVDVSGQAKVCNLHKVAFCDQHIPGSQIPVYTLP